MKVHPDGSRRQYISDRLSGKKSKQDANYRPAEHDTNENCSECQHYLSPGGPESSCKIVAGIVEGDMLSDYFQPRTEENSGAGVNININIGR